MKESNFNAEMAEELLRDGVDAKYEANWRPTNTTESKECAESVGFNDGILS